MEITCYWCGEEAKILNCLDDIYRFACEFCHLSGLKQYGNNLKKIMKKYSDELWIVEDVAK